MSPPVTLSSLGTPDDGRSVPNIEALLADPAVSRTFKIVLDAWLLRDPVDAANDAELLAAVLGRRVDMMLGRAT